MIELDIIQDRTASLWFEMYSAHFGAWRYAGLEVASRRCLGHLLDI